MFAFKARSISEPIADPFTAGTTIPTNAVIFMANNDMTSYTSSSKWSFINMSQSGDVPSQIRGTETLSGANKTITKNITDAFTTSNVGQHIGNQTYRSPKYTALGGGNPYSSANIRTNDGGHTHSVSGLSNSSNLGGVYSYSAVVAAYKCIASTREIPKGAIIFAQAVQNEDFIPIDQFNRNSSGYGRFDGAGLISGSLTWLATNAPFSVNNGIYGTSTSSITLTPTISTSGSHTHEDPAANGGLRTDYDLAFNNTVDNTTAGLGSIAHTHNANGMYASAISPKVYFMKAYRAVRNTSVYKGMILGWAGTLTSELPQGWYVCNGQTINGFKTPQANVNAIICMTSLSNFHNFFEGTDTASITYAIGGTQGQHRHYTKSGSTSSILANGTWANFHSDNPVFPWDHRHDGTGAINYKQGSYTLNFIIYLG